MKAIENYLSDLWNSITLRKIKELKKEIAELEIIINN